MPLTSKERRQLRDFGAAVRRERMAQGLTQEKLAERVGMNPRYIQKVEAGLANMPLTTALRFRAALSCPFETLLS